MHGVVDLAVCVGSSMYVIDWKTNMLANGYSQDSLQQAVIANDYTLQADMYMEAMGKFLEHASDAKLSGFFFVFLRGIDDLGSGALFLEEAACTSST